MANGMENPFPPSPPAVTDGDGDHLQYLLTAYLFDSLSEAGRREVEEHLEVCANCRAELELLKATLGEVEAALHADARRYQFEERRRQRVMQAAKRENLRLLPRVDLSGMGRLRWRFAALAGMVALLVLGSVVFMTPLRRTKSYRIEESKAEYGYMKSDEDASEKYVIKDYSAVFDPASQGHDEPESQEMPEEVPNAGGFVGNSVMSRGSESKGSDKNLPMKKSYDMKSPSIISGMAFEATRDRDSGEMMLDRPEHEGGKEPQKTDTSQDNKPSAPINVPKDRVEFNTVAGSRNTVSDESAQDKQEMRKQQRTKEGIVMPPGGKNAVEETPRPGEPSEPASGPVSRTFWNGYSSGEGGGGGGGFYDGDYETDSTVSAVKTAKKGEKEIAGQAEDLKKQSEERQSGKIYTEQKETESGEASAGGGGGNDGGFFFGDNETSSTNSAVKSAKKGENKIAGQAEDLKKSSDERQSAKKYTEQKETDQQMDGQQRWQSRDRRIETQEDLEEVDDSGRRSTIPSRPTQSLEPLKAEALIRQYNHFQQGQSGPVFAFDAFAKRPIPIPPPVLTDEGLDEDEFIQRYNTRPFVDASRDHLSTFAMDVDIGSYTQTRSKLNSGQLPDPSTVRVEEFVNNFKQEYTVTGDEAFGVFAEGGPAPFAGVDGVELLKIGIKSRDPRPGERKPATITLAIDSSGSMASGQRLDLVRQALHALIDQLRPEDAVCIVAFGGQAELVLPRTFGRDKQRILDSLGRLQSKGGTNVEAGLNLAYRMADEIFSPEAVNRVILCSDGVANVGPKGPEEVLKRVKIFAGRGIDLITIGFGKGRYDDRMMEQLANNGNGSNYFIDTLQESRRVFMEQLPPHLNVLARDAKVQVDFNPDVVERYRLLGYENRKIADKDFRNDKIDAGEVTHSTLVTALYEIKRKPLSHGPLGKVYLRWKDGDEKLDRVVERNYPLPEGILASSKNSSSVTLRFLACVAEFAELLRDSRWSRDGSYTAVLSELNELPQSFCQGNAQWQEVVDLVENARRLSVEEWARVMEGK